MDELKNYLLVNFLIMKEHFRLKDVLDLFIVWLVVYRVLLLIRGTHVVQMLSGLGFLAVGYILSRWLELFTLNWLLDEFFSNLFVIAVILFQSEIRKALVHFGRTPFFANVSASESTQVLNEVMLGLETLARQKLGALVVIEREIGLGDFIEWGTLLDAKASSNLIISLFQLRSPTHDGALVIRDGRAYSVGCFLPLLKAPGVDKGWGTRHRAALGLTEETDAAVLVVSEENGQMGLSIRGQMLFADAKTIQEKLESHLYIKQKRTL